MDQRNRIEILKVNPHIYRQLVFYQATKNTQWGKNTFLNKWYWENWMSRCKRIKLKLFLILYTKINSKLLKGLNLTPETVKLLGKNTREKLHDIGLGNDFMDITHKKHRKQRKNKQVKLYQSFQASIIKYWVAYRRQKYISHSSGD